MSRSRSTLLATLRTQNKPVTLGALTRATGLHENTLRGHLDALVKDGLVTRSAAAAAGRGRPAWLYEATDADPDRPTEYAGLASALAEAIHLRSPEPVADALAAGRRWGRDLAQRRGAGPQATTVEARRQVVGLLDDLGVAPETDPDGKAVRLTRCPLLEAAHRYPDVVCGVHLGLTQGALTEYGANPDGTELLPFAEPGACLLHLVAGPA